MAARYRIPIVVLASDGSPLANASMSVRNRDTAAAVTVYAAETGATTLTVAQQVSDALGRMPGWTDAPLPLEATVTPPAGSGLAPYVEAWDAAPAGPGDVTPPWLDGSSLVFHIADVYANRPAAAAALNGVRFFATDKLMEWQCIAAAWVLVVAHPLVSAAKPGTPIDGQRWRYVFDAANNVVWDFVYDGATSKWKYLHGTPARDEVAAAQNGGAGVYANAATAGPAIAIPFAGDYHYLMGFETDNMPGTGLMALDGAGLVAADADAVTFVGQSVTWVNSGGGNTTFTPSGHSSIRRQKKTLTAATVTAKYKGAMPFRARWLELWPAAI